MHLFKILYLNSDGDEFRNLFYCFLVRFCFSPSEVATYMSIMSFIGINDLFVQVRTVCVLVSPFEELWLTSSSFLSYILLFIVRLGIKDELT